MNHYSTLASLQRTFTAQHSATLASVQRTFAAQQSATFASLQRTFAAQHSATLASVQRTLGEVERSYRQTIPLQSTIGDVTRALEQIVSIHQTATKTALLAQQEQLRWTATQIAGLSRIPTFTPIIRPTFFETPAWILEAERLNEIGWFPHTTFPRHLLKRKIEDSKLDDLILGYYRDNWATVRQVVEEELSACHVEGDIKKTLREALQAHQQGLYSLVPSSLFPAIERAVRVRLCANGFGNIAVKEQLEGWIGNLPLSMLPCGAFGYAGLSQLSHHLYETIYSEATRKRFVAASVPNRHAAIHGLVAYSSEKSSLNAIFVAVFVFQALTVSTPGVPRRF